MTDNIIKLSFGLFVFTCFTSCYSPNIKETVIENNQFIDSLDNQVKSSFIDSVGIDQLIKNKWLQVVTSDCINYLMFKEDGTYEEDNCEWDLTFEGKYYTLKDSIFLAKYDLASELPNEHRIVNTAIYTYIYQRDSLKFISNKRIEDGTVMSTYYPNAPIYFIRREK